MNGTLLSLILGILIFSYGGYWIYRSVKDAKKGKCTGCSSCEHSKECSSYVDENED
jgi:hypothetical protein